MTEETRVTRNDETSRYEIHVGDALGGYATFVISRSGRVLMTHTEIDPAFKGQGLGSILAGEALADLAERREVVVPRCPFIAHYLEGHEVAGLTVDWPADAEASDTEASDTEVGETEVRDTEATDAAKSAEASS